LGAAVVEAESFGQRLRRLRQAAGLSQEGLAERAGLTPAAVGALERGARRHPYPGTLHALAQALKLAPAEREVFFLSVAKRGYGGREDQLLPHAPPPVPLTGLVGRAREMALAAGLFLRANARIVTLTGPPGVGKTRLAAELALRLPADMNAGVVWVDLAPVPDPELVLPSVARALSLPEPAGKQAAQVLESYLARRRLLLVLDNFEHVLPAGPSLGLLAGKCSGLAVLATSREALGVRGEFQFPVAPLGVPERAEGIAGISRSGAAELFLQRVRSVAPALELTGTDASTVAAICRKLDGIPLALELAAAQLKYMSPASLLHRLDRRLSVLEGGPRDLPERQRSLRAALEWSYELLGAADQALFRQLSVFEGGFTEEAADAVCGQAGSVRSLVDKCLLQPASSRDDEPRFSMLETLREYARQRLRDADEEVAVRQRHAGYYCRLAEIAAPRTAGAGREPFLHRLDLEWPNLRSALAWSVEHDNRCTGLRIAGALGWFWNLRGYVAEGRQWTDRLLAGDLEGCEPAERASALYVAAILAWKQADTSTVRRLADESIALRRAVGDDRPLAFSLAAAGLIAISENRLEEGKDLLEESLALFRLDGEPWGIAYGLSNLGDVLLSGADLAGARALYQESLNLFSRLGDGWGCGLVEHTLGGVGLAQGDAAGARLHFERSLAHFRSIGNMENVARSLIGLAAAALAQRGADEAESSLRESLEIWQDFASMTGVAACLEGLAGVEVSRGRFRAAVRLFGAADHHRLSERPVFMVDPHLFSGYLHEARCRLDERTFAEAWAEGTSVDVDSILAADGGGRVGSRQF